AGTYPAVFGRGEHEACTAQGSCAPTLSSATWFCGTAPDTLNVSSAPSKPVTNGVTFSNAFGTVLFTGGGAISLNLDPPGNSCATQDICGEPVTFFLVSPRAQDIVVQNGMDNAGAIYVDGARKLSGLSGWPNTSTISVPAGPFALS